MNAEGEPRFELDRPDRFLEGLRDARYSLELRSKTSLSLMAASFFGPAVLVAAMTASLAVGAVAGLFGLVLVGRRVAGEIAEGRAKTWASARLRDALREHWLSERPVVADWGRRHGLDPIDSAGFMVGLDTPPILLEGREADYANVLRGPVGGATATFFHLTQLGSFPGRPASHGHDDVPAFRWLTCVHTKRRPRDLVMTLHPREPATPPCGLNQVPLSAVGDAWRSSPARDRERRGVAEIGAAQAQFFERMVAAGWFPPRALELMRDMEAAEGERRKQLEEQIRQEMVAWRQRRGRPGGLGGMLELLRAMKGPEWREVTTESVAFNERYRLRTMDLDDLEVMGIFDPVLIVQMTESLPTPLFVEVHDENLIVARPGRILDPDELDELLTTADRLGRQLDDSPAPA